MDIALICHKGPDIETAFYEIRTQNETNEALNQNGLKSVNRVLTCKEKFIRYIK